jgi:hypothetical protein
MQEYAFGYRLITISLHFQVQVEIIKCYKYILSFTTGDRLVCCKEVIAIR